MQIPVPFDTLRQGIEQPIVIRSAATSVAIFIGWYLFWHFSGYIKTIRQRAYVLSLLSSFTTTIASFPLVWDVIRNNGDFQVLMLPERQWPIAVTTFFLTFLTLDLVIGSVLYRSKIELLTGWIHHIVYFGTLIWVIQHKYCSAFVTMCVLEAPTFLLALGSINKRLRHDYLFAATFVTSRIVFHAYMIYNAYVFLPYGHIGGTLFAFFPLHCYWFYGFIKQQQRIRSQPKKGNKESSDKMVSTPAADQKKQHVSPCTVSRTKHQSKTGVSVQYSISKNSSVIDRLALRLPETLQRELRLRYGNGIPYLGGTNVYTNHEHTNHEPSVVSVH